MKKNGRTYARVSDEEYESWNRAAKSAGITVSDLIRFSVGRTLREDEEVVAVMLRSISRRGKGSAMHEEHGSES